MTMKALILVFFLAASSAAADSAKPEPAAAIIAKGATLILSDGRTFTNWSIKRQTAALVFIISPIGITGVEKKFLPDEMRAQFPIDPAAIAAEKSELAREDAAAKTLVAADQAKAKTLRDRQIAVAIEDAKTKSRDEFNALEKLRRERCVDGLYLIPGSAELTIVSAKITMCNPTGSARPFDWHGIKIETKKGGVTPTQIVPMRGEKLDLLIPAHSERTFVLCLENLTDVPWLIAWKTQHPTVSIEKYRAPRSIYPDGTVIAHQE